MPFRQQRLEQLEQRLELARRQTGAAADQRRVAADLAQPRQRREDRDLVLAHATGRRRHLVNQGAAALELGEVELPLLLCQLAVASFFDALRQIGGDLALHAPQEHRPQLGGQQRADVRRRVGPVEARAELRPAAQIPGVHERHDAPQIEGAVLERRAGQRQPMAGAQRERRAAHDGVGVLDVLRFVENRRAQVDRAPLLQVASQQRVRGDDQVVGADVAPQRVAFAAAGEQQDAQGRRKVFGLTGPVVHDRRRTHDQTRAALRILLAHMQQPRQRLDGLSQTHVVGQHGADAQRGGVREKVQTAPLVRPQLARASRPAPGRIGKPVNRATRVAQFLNRTDRRRVGAQALERFEALRFGARELPERQPLRLPVPARHRDRRAPVRPVLAWPPHRCAPSRSAV